MPTSPRAAAVALASVALVAGCGGANSKPAAQAAGGAETATDAGGVQQLTVQASDQLAFAQTDLRAHTGRVQITLQVPGQVPHDLMFADGPTGGTSTVSHGSASTTLTFATPGTYHFLCTIHPRMQGTLTITAGP